MKRSELNEMTVSELDVKLQENQEALQNLRFQKSLQQETAAIREPIANTTFEKRDRSIKDSYP